MKTETFIQISQNGREQGFVLVFTLMIMVVLSLIGVAALKTTNMELKISGNDYQEKQVFQATESGCMRGGQWLSNLQLAQATTLADADFIAANVANIAAGNLNDMMDIKEIQVTGAKVETNIGGGQYPAKYNYIISETNLTAGGQRCLPSPGNPANLLDCYYEVECSSATTVGAAREVTVIVKKPTQF